MERNGQGSSRRSHVAIVQTPGRFSPLSLRAACFVAATFCLATAAAVNVRATSSSMPPHRHDSAWYQCPGSVQGAKHKRLPLLSAARGGGGDENVFREGDETVGPSGGGGSYPKEESFVPDSSMCEVSTSTSSNRTSRVRPRFLQHVKPPSPLRKSTLADVEGAREKAHPYQWTLSE